MDQILLDRYCPPAILFDEELEVLLLRGASEDLLEPAVGAGGRVAGQRLKAALREPLSRAAREMAAVSRRGVTLERRGVAVVRDLLVVPLVDGSSERRMPRFLVVFEAHMATPAPYPALEAGVEVLRHELDLARFQVKPLDRPGRSEHYASLFATRVLVVDDDPATLAALIDVLKLSGATVRAAASAAAARSALAEFAAQLIVCDISMPDEDGNTFMRKVRAGGLNVPALALTARTSEDDRRRAFAAGYQLHLAKPVDIDRLRDALVELLGFVGHA
ncbi:MAG TPA: response regulator [Polyangiales bacterium]|nr:response regulator [Polyangiales bacterium]